MGGLAGIWAGCAEFVVEIWGVPSGNAEKENLWGGAIGKISSPLPLLKMPLRCDPLMPLLVLPQL